MVPASTHGCLNPCRHAMEEIALLAPLTQGWCRNMLTTGVWANDFPTFPASTECTPSIPPRKFPLWRNQTISGSMCMDSNRACGYWCCSLLGERWVLTLLTSTNHYQLTSNPSSCWLHFRFLENPREEWLKMLELSLYVSWKNKQWTFQDHHQQVTRPLCQVGLGVLIF